MLTPKCVVHDEQVDKTFENESTNRVAEMKTWGCKVLKIADIMQRKARLDREKGKVVLSASASAIDGDINHHAARKLPHVPHHKELGPIAFTVATACTWVRFADG